MKELLKLIGDHAQAWAFLGEFGDADDEIAAKEAGRQVTKADKSLTRKALDGEANAMRALIEYIPANATEVRGKAAYLLKTSFRDCEATDPDNIDALLRSFARVGLTWTEEDEAARQRVRGLRAHQAGAA